jgi:uncharacterized protein YkwD
VNGWDDPIDPIDPDAPYRRPSPPADRSPYPFRAESPYPSQNEPEYPSRADGWYDPVPSADPADRPAGGPRRHRAPRRRHRSATVAGAAAVATLVVAVGAGALLLPRDGPQGAATAGTAGPEIDATAVPTGAPVDPASGAVSTAPDAPGADDPPPPATPTRKATSIPRRSPTRAATAASGGSGGATAGSSQAEQVVALVNRERDANGCGDVKINDKLAAAAQAHSQDQAAHDTMSHTGSDGSSPWDRAGRAGYSQAIGENVAAGYRTPAAVMDGWMNSAGHRANILNCQARAIGVGVAAASDGTLYWTQMFGSAP